MWYLVITVLLGAPLDAMGDWTGPSEEYGVFVVLKRTETACRESASTLSIRWSEALDDQNPLVTTECVQR